MASGRTLLVEVLKPVKRVESMSYSLLLLNVDHAF